MPALDLAEKKEVKNEPDTEPTLEAVVVDSEDSDKENLTAKTTGVDTKIIGNDDVVYLHDDKSNGYSAYNGSEEFYKLGDSGKNYYDLLMKIDEEKSALPVVEVHEDKVEKQAEQVSFESWRANGGVNFLMSDGLTRYEHTGAVAASSVSDEERRIFSLMYPGWVKCLYDLGKVLVSSFN